MMLSSEELNVPLIASIAPSNGLQLLVALFVVSCEFTCTSIGSGYKIIDTIAPIATSGIGNSDIII